MKRTLFPSPIEALSDLEGFRTPLYDAFEGAANIGRELFEIPGYDFDLHHYCSTVRFHVKRLLRAQGVDMEDLDNTGLCTRYGRYRLKMFKAYRGFVPVPGRSKMRQGFYSQETLPLTGLLQMLADMQGGLVNLLVVWEPNRNHDLERLSLALPRFGSANSAAMHWDVAIPHPALSIAPDEVVITEDDDLDIRRPDEEATGTEDEEPDV